MKSKTLNALTGFLCAPALLCLCLCVHGCAAGPVSDPGKTLSFPEEWTRGGRQTAAGDAIRKASGEIHGRTAREKIRGVMEYVWGTFSYDPWYKTEAFTKTAEELFQGRVLSGCSDYALVEIALFRALGIPCRMVITCNVDWIHMYRMDGLSLSEGHSFVEVYLDGRWHLVDTTYRWLFNGYDPAHPFYPHGEVFCRRGVDFWDMGLRSMQDLDRMLKDKAADYPGGYEEPGYPKHPL